MKLDLEMIAGLHRNAVHSVLCQERFKTLQNGLPFWGILDQQLGTVVLQSEDSSDEFKGADTTILTFLPSIDRELDRRINGTDGPLSHVELLPEQFLQVRQFTA